jgi:outer membrane protein OmpA-like peptidoglycan-associated protein/Tol biopolymer transport system component
MRRAIFLFMMAFLMVCTLKVQGQQLSTGSKKAEKLFYDASDQYNAGNIKPALDLISRALTEDPSFIEAWILKGDIQAEAGSNTQAAESYEKAIAINPDFSPRLYYIIGNIALSSGKYAEARDDYMKYLSYEKIPEKGRQVAAQAIRNCEFGIKAMEHPVPFNPVNLGDSINTPYSEYVNTITADDQVLYFTRNIPGAYTTSGLQEDFFYSVRSGAAWQKARSLGPPINTGGNEGGLFISPDGRFLFFAACDRPDGMGSCDIYWSKREGTRWSDPENLGPVVNSGTWDSQPSFSSDGKTLYFASRRPGGYGSSDIWKSVLQDDNTWSAPENLGDSINTPREEMAPFIHPDDQTLYFSSKGHPGMGGLDLYYSKKDVLGRWKTPVNLGYPINTQADEITLLVNSTGDVAYISSDKLGGYGRQDIYSFDLYKEAQPARVTYFKGIVFDKVTKNRLEASFELSDLETGKTVVQSASDPVTGEFLLILPLNKEYALNVSKEGYLFFSDHFSLAAEGVRPGPVTREIPLQPVQVGETVILKNIFFDTDKYNLKPESRVELEKLVALLNKNPGLKIEISGHTDNVGTPAYNIELSNNRAKAVYEYLVARGIDKNRLTYAGYGLTRPIDTNDTEQGRANNRRTEFRITAK